LLLLLLSHHQLQQQGRGLLVALGLSMLAAVPAACLGLPQLQGNAVVSLVSDDELDVMLAAVEGAAPAQKQQGLVPCQSSASGSSRSRLLQQVLQLMRHDALVGAVDPAASSTSMLASSHAGAVTARQAGVALKQQQQQQQLPPQQQVQHQQQLQPVVPAQSGSDFGGVGRQGVLDMRS
jgi:hypothetical protein